MSTSAPSAPAADLRYPGHGPEAVGLGPTLRRAARSPFFARRLVAAGVDLDRPVSWDSWRAITPTSKDELRSLDSFEEEVVIAPRRDVLEFWRSGGVTGRPLYYPRTRADVEHSVEAFARGLRIAGITADDTVMCSLPLGIHPAGQLVARAAEHLGAAVVWAGAGNQLPSAAQIELVREFGATVWCGMASFGLHLAHLAEAAGAPLADTPVRRVITTAEVLSAPKRALLERLWGADVRDIFGMTEVTLMGAECGRAPGLHMWTESSFCEVLDPETSAPVAPGEVGTLCVSSVATTEATPFVRWLSGDVVRLEFDCDCPDGRYPRVVHSGRTSGFFKVKGVNVNHLEAEERLYAIPELRDFRVLVTPDDRLRVELEAVEGASDPAAAAVEELFVDAFGVRPDVVPVPRGTIANATGDQLKAQRFVDQRPGA